MQNFLLYLCTGPRNSTQLHINYRFPQIHDPGMLCYCEPCDNCEPCDPGMLLWTTWLRTAKLLLLVHTVWISVLFSLNIHNRTGTWLHLVSLHVPTDATHWVLLQTYECLRGILSGFCLMRIFFWHFKLYHILLYFSNFPKLYHIFLSSV